MTAGDTPQWTPASRDDETGGISTASVRSVCVAVDAMSGDAGPAAAVEGVLRAIDQDPWARFVLHGDLDTLASLLAAQDAPLDRIEMRGANAVVAMDDTPRTALRRGDTSSMAAALRCAADGAADAAVSAGNTAALMALATLRLQTAPNVARPAIAALWPAISPAGAAVVLDVGGDMRSDAASLTANAAMGAAYATAALGVQRPRIALLNVGSEPNKGRADIRAAAERLRSLDESGRLSGRYVGFVEADAIAFDAADVIVTDGFSGNVALKAAEGAARLVGRFVSEAFRGSTRGRVGAVLAGPALRELKARMDPRRVNGGVFLGLRALVVKSHGAADGEAFAAALGLAIRAARGNIAGLVSQQVAQTAGAAVDPARRDDAAAPPAATEGSLR